MAENINEVEIVITLMYNYISIKEEKEKIKKAIEDDVFSNPNVSDVQIYWNRIFRDNFDFNESKMYFNPIIAYLHQEERQEKTYHKSINKELNAYKKAMDILTKQANKKEIVGVKEIVEDIENPFIKEAILEYIYEHNKKYYQELENQQEDGIESLLPYHQYLLSKTIPVSKDNLKKISLNSLEDVEKMSQKLMKIQLDRKTIAEILTIADPYKVEVLVNGVLNGVYSKTFLLNNLSLFKKDSIEFKRLMHNISILQKFGINLTLFVNNTNILLEESSKIEKGLMYLKDYQLLKAIKADDDLSFILDPKLYRKLDKFIELGYINYIFEDINLLNTQNIKRLELLHAMNISINSIEELHEILKTDKFFVSDEVIDEYIPDAVGYKEAQPLTLSLSELEESSYDDYSYLINGILVSKNKVKRRLLKSKSDYDSIFHLMSLSDDEYDKLILGLKPFIKIKK